MHRLLDAGTVPPPCSNDSADPAPHFARRVPERTVERWGVVEGGAMGRRPLRARPRKAHIARAIERWACMSLEVNTKEN